MKDRVLKKKFGKNRFRFAAYLLTVCMLLSFIPTTFAADSADSNEEKLTRDQVIFDMEKGVGSFTGGTEVVDKERSGGSVYRLNKGSTGYFYLTDNSETASTVFSFDFKTTGPLAKAYFELLNADATEDDDYVTRFKKTLWLNEGKMQVFGTMDYRYVANLTDTDPGNWHHMDMCVDFGFDRGFVYYFLDGELLKMDLYWDYYNQPGDARSAANPCAAMTDIMPDLKRLNGIKITSDGREGGVDFDNFKVYSIKDYAEPTNFDYEFDYPFYYGQWLKLDNDAFGSNFVGRNIEYNASITNPYLKDGDFSYSLKVYNDSQEIIKTFEDTVHLKSGETKEFKLNFDSLGYGFYKMEGEAWENLTDNRLTIDKEFSVSVKSETHNEKMAVCNHALGHFMGICDIVEHAKYLSDIGLGSVREDDGWVTSSGEYSEATKLVMGSWQSNKMRYIMFLDGGMWNGSYNTEEELEKLRANTIQQVTLSKDYDCDYEFYNEYNISANNKADQGYSAENYVRALKIVYEEVKRIKPEAKVYAIGSATNMDADGKLGIPNFFDFTQKCLDLGAGNYCDGFAVHPYPGSAGVQKGVDLFEQLVKLYEDNGYGDKEIVITEAGFSNPDDDMQAEKQLQYVNAIGNNVDRLCLYVDMMKEGSTAAENVFGMIHSAHWQFNYPKEPYRARKTMVALAAYNNIMNGAYEQQRLKSDDEKNFFYMSKLPGGKSGIAMYTDNESPTDVVFNISGTNLVLYDGYGNETKLTPADGKVSVTLESLPKYITGNISNVSVKSGSMARISQKEVTIAPSDSFRVTVANSSNIQGAEVEVTVPDNLTVKELKSFDGDNPAEIYFESGSKMLDGSVVKISVKNQNGVYVEQDLKVNYIDSVSAEVKTSYFRSGRWRYRIQIHNNNMTNYVSGKLIVDSPTEVSAAEKEVRFENIPPKSEKDIYINIPVAINDAKSYFSGRIIMDDGNVINIGNEIYKSGIAYTYNSPKIDGKIENGEWFKDAYFELKYESQVQQITDWKGEKDVGGKLYLMYDNDNFYLAAEITDDILGDNDAQGRIWANDSIQFAFSELKETGKPRTEFGIGLVNGKPSIDRYAYMGILEGMAFVEDKKDFTGIEYEIIRDEDKKVTYYEAKFPWTQIFPEGFNIEKFDSLYYSMLVNDNDKAGRRGWIEYCSGIGWYKDPGQFMDTMLLKRNVFRYN